MQHHILIVAAFVLAGCAMTADGPTFSTQAHTPIPPGYTRVYMFRDRVLYLAQAPYVVRAEIVLDGHPVGALLNGAYLSIDIPAGVHKIIAQSAGYYTMRDFTADTGTGYIEISDWTRMEGARMAVEGGVGFLEARGNAIQAGETRQQRHIDELSGAADAIGADPAYSGPERVWDVEFPAADDAMPRLKQLSRAQ